MCHRPAGLENFYKWLIRWNFVSPPGGLRGILRLRSRRPRRPRQDAPTGSPDAVQRNPGGARRCWLGSLPRCLNVCAERTAGEGPRERRLRPHGYATPVGVLPVQTTSVVRREVLVGRGLAGQLSGSYWNSRSSCEQRQDLAIFAAHSMAASRDGSSKTQKPPLNSLVCG